MSDTITRFMAGESLQNIINERTCELVDYSAPVLDQLGVASDKALHQIMSQIRAELAAAHEREKALRDAVMKFYGHWNDQADGYMDDAMEAMFALAIRYNRENSNE